MNDKPRYLHACKHCEFYGYWGAYDLYACHDHKFNADTLTDGTLTSIIARRSSEPSDYASSLTGLFSPVGADIPHRIAMRACLKRVLQSGALKMPPALFDDAWRHVVKPHVYAWLD